MRFNSKYYSRSLLTYENIYNNFCKNSKSNTLLSILHYDALLELIAFYIICIKQLTGQVIC